MSDWTASLYIAIHFHGSQRNEFSSKASSAHTCTIIQYPIRPSIYNTVSSRDQLICKSLSDCLTVSAADEPNNNWLLEGIQDTALFRRSIIER